MVVTIVHHDTQYMMAVVRKNIAAAKLCKALTVYYSVKNAYLYNAAVEQCEKGRSDEE